MPFYQCDVKTVGFGLSSEVPVNHMAQEISRQIKVLSNNNNNNSNTFQAFLNFADDERLVFVFSTKKTVLNNGAIAKFLQKLDIKHSNISIKEITMRSFTQMARECNGTRLHDDDKMTRCIEIESLYQRRENNYFEESIMENGATKSEILKKSKKILCDKTLIPEVSRIFAKKSGGVTNGHPVHYIVKSDSAETRTAVTDILLKALIANNRLVSKRYCTVDFDEKVWTDSDYLKLCRNMLGGAMVITYQKGNSIATVKEMCNSMAKYNQGILYIFCLPQNSGNTQKMITENFYGVPFVTVAEEAVMNDDEIPFVGEVDCYLKMLAKEANIEPNDMLFSSVEPYRKYYADELQAVFNNWNSWRLKSEVYTQYAEVEAIDVEMEEEDYESTAYGELCDMVGLAKAKEVINQALDFSKAQKLFRDNGVEQNRPAMNMIFTGNPGTAKTTVARLFARIMKENGLIEGNLHEVGRTELIGKYIGHTAPNVKYAFYKARGGVLFIDEAYSLVDHRDGSFGDEAINTIVQEMENNRDNTVVIFAGYPDKMEDFLNKNPGLRSRINFHVLFDDYEAHELFAITELMAKNHHITLENDVRDKLIPIFGTTKKETDFGNGRFARNLFEKARIRQASRLVKMETMSLTKEILTTLTANDFEIPQNMKQETQKIGFCASAV